jgi:hypothetical protein
MESECTRRARVKMKLAMGRSQNVRIKPSSHFVRQQKYLVRKTEKKYSFQPIFSASKATTTE